MKPVKPLEQKIYNRCNNGGYKHTTKAKYTDKLTAFPGIKSTLSNSDDDDKCVKMEATTGNTYASAVRTNLLDPATKLPREVIPPATSPVKSALCESNPL